MNVLTLCQVPLHPFAAAGLLKPRQDLPTHLREQAVVLNVKMDGAPHSAAGTRSAAMALPRDIRASLFLCLWRNTCAAMARHCRWHLFLARCYSGAV